ncbi:MAG: hypothetical protein J5935_04730 [Lachnospiraceae bacterium]|nr:hypothetical protein [Lachnospiraceae bacterium]
MAGTNEELHALLSEEERAFLKDYEETLKAIDIPSEDVLTAIKIQAMAGERGAQQDLATYYLPKVVDLARLYVGQGVMLEDLIGAGNEALLSGTRLLMALERPDEVEGDLGNRMMRAMEALIEEDFSNKAAEAAVLEKVNRVKEKADELAEDLRRKVTPEELAAEGELTLEEIEEAVRFSGNQIESLDIEKR